MRAVSRSGAAALLLATTACSNTAPQWVEGKSAASNAASNAPFDAPMLAGQSYTLTSAPPLTNETQGESPAVGVAGYAAVSDAATYVTVGALDAPLAAAPLYSETVNASDSAPALVPLSAAEQPQPQNSFYTEQQSAPEEIVIAAATPALLPLPQREAPRQRQSLLAANPVPVQSAARMKTPQAPKQIATVAPVAPLAPKPVAPAQPKRPSLLQRMFTKSPKIDTSPDIQQTAPIVAKAPIGRSSAQRVVTRKESAPSLSAPTLSAQAMQDAAPAIAKIGEAGQTAMETRSAGLRARLPRIGRPASLNAPRIMGVPSIATESAKAAPARPSPDTLTKLARPSLQLRENAPDIDALTRQPKELARLAPRFDRAQRAERIAPKAVQRAAPAASAPAPQYIEVTAPAFGPLPHPEAEPKYVSVDLAPQSTPAPSYIQIEASAFAQPRQAQPEYISVPADNLFAALPNPRARTAPSAGRGKMQPIYDVPDTVIGDLGETRMHARKEFRPDLVLASGVPLPRLRSQFSAGFGRTLERAALGRLNPRVRYDAQYHKIGYPWGDVDHSTGVCTDVVIRSYRTLGIDLQQLVHEDMRYAFKAYPSQRIYGLRKADANIDHRRVVNLEAFFERVGARVPLGNGPDDFLPGDVLTWRLNGTEPHIGIVVQERDPMTGYPMVVHNLGAGVRKEDLISIQTPVGQYRFAPSGGAGSNQLISGLQRYRQGG